MVQSEKRESLLIVSSNKESGLGKVSMDYWNGCPL